MSARPKRPAADERGGIQNAISINTIGTPQLGTPRLRSKPSPVVKREQVVKRAIADALKIDPWLSSSSAKWATGFGDGWVGKEILGRGGFGLAGRWEYCGKSEPGKEWEAYTKNIVVKQSMMDDLDEEARFLKTLNGTGSTHFPRVYKWTMGTGAGTDGHVDMRGVSVQRMFLEFCEGGDLWKVNRSAIQDPSKRLTEVQLWSIFLCIARAVAVMDCGSESGEPQPGWTKICHFDIKPGNLFLGGHDSGEHSEMNQVKTGDFGLAVEIEDPELQNSDYNQEHGDRGTPSFRAPEQEWGFANDQSHTNIYSMACVMWCMMTNERRGPGVTLKFTCDTLSPQLRRGQTIGSAILETNYSNTLKSLVLECLMMQFRLRPSVKELLQRTREGLDLAMNAMDFQKTEHNRESFVGDPPATPAVWNFMYREPIEGWQQEAPPIYSAQAERQKRKRSSEEHQSERQKRQRNSEGDTRNLQMAERANLTNVQRMLALAVSGAKTNDLYDPEPLDERPSYEVEGEDAVVESVPPNSLIFNQEVWDGTFFVKVYPLIEPIGTIHVKDATPDMTVRQFKRLMQQRHYTPFAVKVMRLQTRDAVEGDRDWDIRGSRLLDTIPGWGRPNLVLFLNEEIPSQV